ncbi:hypothetical protein MPTK1_8g09620 [Marchantia polymorpha subsp. ruderalis]|uniref:Uncharacterized protein n=2 Tax=Marchantia polymorpha TaxID=3197 RepID=A0A176VTZ9_MARPO|nr:hypothetical protein AXG93_1528s1180 [Marchantia polymorpha subsp. ruderalis]PTQ47517.1 hypothetical protein MARPO_0008s0259 [Marchantia polymorpha]BBN19316.1 hypothetical protein Mp_8g09620 [Marchantia polymorpha subsp. ruderalis]|eukprot:PTQ47517.1 hypothetical protein MARPO_0008s0259 [Marchantia polymorpha]
MDFNWPAEKGLLKDYIESRRKKPKLGQSNLFGCFGYSSVNKVKPPERVPEPKIVSMMSYVEQAKQWQDSLRTNPDWRDQIEPEQRRLRVSKIFRKWRNANEKTEPKKKIDLEAMKEEISTLEENFWNESKSVEEYDKKIQWAKDPSRQSVKFPGMTPEMEHAKRKYLALQKLEEDASFLPDDDVVHDDDDPF